MRPRADASLLSRLTASVPARLVKRLDNAPRTADSWTWDELRVTTDSGETVELTPSDGVVSEISQLRCSCLLAPRCFHVLAVAAALETAESTPGVEPTLDENSEPALVHVEAAQRAIAEHAVVLLGDWLTVGSAAAGAVLQGELLRVVHEARIAGVHRLASAALRVVRGARALRGERPEFDAHDLLDDLRDLGSTAHLVATREQVPRATLGSARREYAPVGALRLYGLGCEPVISRAGHAGVTSYVCDERGTLYTLSDVLPAEASRALGAYELAVAMGDTSISHRELTRSGLFVQDAAASQDLRLSAGKRVKAVRGSAAPSYDGSPLAQLFTAPLAEQLDRAFAALEAEPGERARSATLVFVRARVVGTSEGALLLSVEDTPLSVVAADDHPQLPYRENLRLLGELVGRTLHLIAHVVPERPRTLAAIALEAPVEALTLPPALRQRLNLGLDRLERSQLVVPERVPVKFQALAALDPLAVLRRRLIALSLNGSSALPSEAARHIDRDRAALREAVMPAGADALGALAEACFRARQQRSLASLPLARAFVAAASYERAATLSLRRATFTEL